MEKKISLIKEMIDNIISDSELPKDLNFNNSQILSLSQEKKHFSMYFASKLLFRIIVNKESVVLEFKPEYAKLFQNNDYVRLNNNWIKIELQSLEDIKLFNNAITEILKLEFHSIQGEAFGCCSDYEVCSDHKKCIKDDLLFSLGCQYRQNLLNDKIFYGKNANV